MPVVRSGNPAAEPLTLAEAKAHCRVDGADEDAYITALISAARLLCEHLTGRTLIRQTWVLTLDAFPDAIALPNPRVEDITSVQYVDTAGATQSLALSGVQLDRASDYANWLVPAYGFSWPATREQPNAVVVTYRAGYGATAADVPQLIKHWLLLTIGSMYAQREALTDKPTSKLGDRFYDGLLDPYRVPGV